MKIEPSRPQRIDRLLEGRPITVGEYQLQPVAHLSGFVGYGGDKNGGGGGWVRLKPQEVTVRASGAAEERLALADPTATALRGIASAGLALAALAWLLMILAWVLRFRQSSAGE